MNKYETVIGMEFHAELKTESKIFCSCSTGFTAEQNTHVCPGCLGLPGALPVLNKRVVELAVKAGLALNCSISRLSQFDRKHYFYPDLPAGYQTTQFPLAVCKGGHIMIDTEEGAKKVRLNRIHIEEDAGKLVHSGESISTSAWSLADYNRSSMPLIEIVTEPDIRSAGEVRDFAEKLKLILQYADVSDVKMEQGSLRCDVNISLRPRGQEEFGTKAEIKNLNSFKAIQRAILYEEMRQAEILDAGGAVMQETRTWDDAAGRTHSMRNKENAHDYRYFPDANLPPVIVDEAWLRQIAAELPELPQPRKERLIRQHGLSPYEANVIINTPALAFFFDGVAALFNEPKTVANWLLGDISRLIKAQGDDEITAIPLSPSHLAELLSRIKAGEINLNTGKAVLEEMFQSGKDPGEIIRARGFGQISDLSALEEAVAKVLAAHPQPAEDYRQGKKQALGFLLGQVMKLTSGQANPQRVSEMLAKRLEKN